MNKRGQFFLEWGKTNKQLVFYVKNFKFKCPCKGKNFNLIYNLQRSHIFWFIPIGLHWTIINVFVQCTRCGAIYKLNSKSKKIAINLYEKKLREGQKKQSRERTYFKEIEMKYKI